MEAQTLLIIMIYIIFYSINFAQMASKQNWCLIFHEGDIETVGSGTVQMHVLPLTMNSTM